MITDNSRPLGEAAGANLDLDTLSLAPRSDSGRSATCLMAALRYAEADVHVFPLSARKKPLALCCECAPQGACPGRDDCLCGVDTCHGFYAATTDRAKILRWWTEHPQWQLGIRTGRSSKLVALDIDMDKGGLDSLIALQRNGLHINGAAVQLSGSGLSFHLLYAHPGGQVPNSQGKLGPGLDVRGDGGYVVGAPSVHAGTGAPYVLLGELRNLPRWPLAASTAKTKTATGRLVQSRPATPVTGGSGGVVDGGPMTPARLHALVRQVREAPEGQRRSTLFWAACRLGESSGSQAALVAAARELAMAAQFAGLDPSEAYATLRDGVRQGRSS